MTSGRCDGRWPWAAMIAGLALAAADPVRAAGPDAGLQTAWTDSYNSRVRLLAGRATAADMTPLVGIEIELAPGWKTYWRMPGDSGGVPPHFDFAGSSNLQRAEVAYPAPSRLTDPTGDAVGYKTRVVFPVELAAVDPTRPIAVTVKLEYGICREICVPAEATLTLDLAAAAALPVSQALAQWWAAVPRAADAKGQRTPRLVEVKAATGGDRPTLRFVIAYPGEATASDLFVEAPDGIYLPLPRKVGAGSDGTVFEIDLSQGVDIAELKGKALQLTMVSSAGHAETRWALP